jgi:hypothetical protein
MINVGVHSLIKLSPRGSTDSEHRPHFGPQQPFSTHDLFLLPRLCLLQPVNFHEGIARGVIHSAYDGGVAPRLQSGDNG